MGTSIIAFPLNECSTSIFFDQAYKIKAALARLVSSGTTGDSDVFGARQKAPLLEIEVPWGE